jgi:dipeptidyl aminopeptidase/acylaminoacyl peptidase
MRCLLSVVVSGCFILILMPAVRPTVLAAQPRRRFTVRDSIEMSSFSRDRETRKEDISFSPDGHYFFAVTRRGVLRSNEIESTIWLFSRSAIKSFLRESSPSTRPSARPLVTMASRSNDEPIEAVRWGADGQTIAFLGRTQDFERHLFIVNISDGKLQQLSPDGQDVTEFDRTENTFVFTSATPVRDSELYQSAGPFLPDIQIGTGLSLFTLLYPRWEEVTFGVSSQQLWVVRSGRASPLIDPETKLPILLMRGLDLSSLALSPSGRYVVATNNIGHIPQQWEAYEPAFPFARFVANEPDSKSQVSNLNPAQFVLIDLQRSKISPLIAAPLGWSAGYFRDAIRAAWSKDEREIALSNTFVPLDRKTPRDGGHPTVRPCVAVVDIVSGQTECIKEISGVERNTSGRVLTNVTWNDAGNELVLRYFVQNGSDDRSTELWRRDNGAWKQVERSGLTEEASSYGGLSITLHQSVNEPPVLVAANVDTGKSRVLLNPNPQLAELELGEAAVYHWHDKAGHEWTGGLVKPPGYVQGRRYPLVIQTHGFNPSEFLTDGSYPTANAARALAARGIVVLQVAEITAAPLFTPQEAEVDGRAGYESAIEQLAREEMIDPYKVGIVGFSHTGWLVLDSLIHTPQYFRAATLAECTYESFGEYLINADYRGRESAKVVAQSIGSEPFGEGIKRWLAVSPGFNTDKIHVPILFEENSPAALIYSWDIYAALRLQSKPVEMLYMRNGEHVLAKPAERLSSQEMNVDWYDFWLNGHEDPDPAKAPQYARWRKLRELQARNPGVQ